MILFYPLKCDHKTPSTCEWNKRNCRDDKMYHLQIWSVTATISHFLSICHYVSCFLFIFFICFILYGLLNKHKQMKDLYNCNTLSLTWSLLYLHLVCLCVAVCAHTVWCLPELRCVQGASLPSPQDPQLPPAVQMALLLASYIWLTWLSLYSTPNPILKLIFVLIYAQLEMKG